jgi:hypothetical protein
MSSPRVKGSPAPNGAAAARALSESASPKNGPGSKLKSKIINVAESQVKAEHGVTGLTSAAHQQVDEEKAQDDDFPTAGSRTSRADTAATFNPFDDVCGESAAPSQAMSGGNSLIDFASFEPSPSSHMEKARPEPLQVDQPGSSDIMSFPASSGYVAHSAMAALQSPQASPFGVSGCVDSPLAKQQQRQSHIHGYRAAIASPQHVQHPALQANPSPMNQNQPLHQQQWNQQQQQQFNNAAPAGVNHSPMMFNSLAPTAPSRTAPAINASAGGGFSNNNVSHASKMDELRRLMAESPSAFDMRPSPQHQQQQHQQQQQQQATFPLNNNTQPPQVGDAFNDIDAFSQFDHGDVKTRTGAGNNNNNNAVGGTPSQPNAGAPMTKTDVLFPFNSIASATQIPSSPAMTTQGNGNNLNAAPRFNPFD